MAERGSLRHCGHLDTAERDADACSQHQGDDDPFVIDNSVVQQRARNGQHHTDLAGPDSAPGSARRAHPFQRQNEQRAGDQINDFNDVLISGEIGHGLVGRLLLNIFSIRSVIRNPPTTLLVAATTAITPSTAEKVLLCSPTSTMAPSTAMASSAFVSDISGVCSSGEIRRMTSKPINAASMKMNSASIRFDPKLPPTNYRPSPRLAALTPAERKIPAHVRSPLPRRASQECR